MYQIIIFVLCVVCYAEVSDHTVPITYVISYPEYPLDTLLNIWIPSSASAEITCCGSGGGGADVSDISTGGSGGGGAGGFIIGYTIPINPTTRLLPIIIGSGGASGINGNVTTIQIDDTMITIGGGLTGNDHSGGNGGSVTIIKNSIIIISVDGKLGGLPGQDGLDTIIDIDQRIFGGASGGGSGGNGGNVIIDDIVIAKGGITNRLENINFGGGGAACNLAHGGDGGTLWDHPNGFDVDINGGAGGGGLTSPRGKMGGHGGNAACLITMTLA
jgi:hypothetical protein